MTIFTIGHSIVPGYITPGTLLYHGRTGYTPRWPEWASFDFEHSYNFGPIIQTYAVSGPGRGLKVLYLDGSSGANMPSGTIDTQVLLTDGELTETGWGKEASNIYRLCDWGERYGIKGFIRMEFDFEVMLCDFTNGVTLVSQLPLIPTAPDPKRTDDLILIPSGDDDRSNLFSRPTAANPLFHSLNYTCSIGAGPKPLPSGVVHPDPWRPRTPPIGWRGSLRPAASALYEVLQAGNWHNAAPGVSGVNLDYNSAISLFDPKYSSLVAARRKISQREMYRAGNISRVDMRTVFADLEEVLKRDPGAVGSGIKWADVMRSVKERHSQRLEHFALTLRPNLTTAAYNITAVVVQIRYQILTILSPFLTKSSVPSASSCREEWLVVPMHYCANTFTGHIQEEYLTPQERLIKRGIEVVMREICRTMGVLWLDAFESEGASKAEQQMLVKRWGAEIERLMNWLGWAEWIRCEPACGPMELCTLPQWPFEMGPESDQEHQDNYIPRCVDRLVGMKD
ncbi:hypothetical protein FRB94_007681 [Tulasnella sp. JGI-2019a]|nr:hypothetical protein FRB94_007681 [Tulasnella sp. JGI-2019a]KAG9001249.1 hypothetical protein FRB93_012175 [Tulasnella sp. JGI-2019a]